MTHERRPPELLGLLGDEETRSILALASGTAVSAKELADRADLSLRTVYRRTEALEELGCLASSTELDEGGNHYRVYETRVSKIEITVDPNDDEVRLELSYVDQVDRFMDLWEGLSDRR